ncbi:MAG: type II secretion system protein [Patescibacteria group bacterium]
MKNKIFARGFTLIEMLIVIAIISILASVFLVGLRGFRGGAYDARRMTDLQRVQSYLEIYYTQNRAYPNVSTWSVLQTTLISANIGVTSIPNDPLPGNNYYYGVDSTDFQSYTLGARFSTSDHSSLQESTEIDGTVFGINCDDPVFCVRF